MRVISQKPTKPPHHQLLPIPPHTKQLKSSMTATQEQQQKRQQQLMVTNPRPLPHQKRTVDTGTSPSSKRILHKVGTTQVLQRLTPKQQVPQSIINN